MTAIDFRDGGFDDGYPAAQAGGRPHAGSFAYSERSWDRVPHEPPAEAAPQGVTARIARLLNYVGALVSVVLMLGLMVWGYRLVTRDVSGVPVIRALAGEARVAPDDPGGELAEGRGLAVNAVAAGEGGAKARKLAMAPETATLAGEDVAMGQLGATVRDPGALSELAPAEAPVQIAALTDSEAAAAAAAAPAEDPALLASTEEPGEGLLPIDPAAAALPDALDQTGAPVAATRPMPRPQRLAVVADPAPADAAPAAPMGEPEVHLAVAATTPAPGPVALAPEAAIPEAKPAEEPRAAKPAEKTAAKPEPKAEDQPEPAKAEAEEKAAAPSGAMVVQIGAFDSDKLARGEWARVSGRNGGLFDGKSQVVQKTQRNGRTFWRLRVAGFGSRDEARAFCAKLKSAGTDCIPTSAN